MNNLPVNISPNIVTKRKLFAIDLKKIVLIEKLQNPLGYCILFACASFIGIVIAKLGFVSAIIIAAGIVGLPVAYGIIVNPCFGIIVFLSMSYLLSWFLRMVTNVPLGTLMDAMEVLLIFGFFLHQKRKADWEIFKGPISLLISIWIVFNLLEFINPVAESKLAWIYTVRSVAVVMLMYFIFLYHIRTKAFIKLIFKIWIGFSFFGALYAFKQQYFGFFGFENRYLHSDPNIELLLFIGGSWRKFSIFSDPVAFSYNMVISSALCIGLLTGPLSKIRKHILYFLIVFFMMNMLFSGTRGAYVLLPAAMILFVVLKYNKKIMMMLTMGILIMIALIFVPTSNSTLYRFQSAFKPSEDASYNVRKYNQKRIQPYILSHPMGGGLGSTGEWGKKFSPNSYLANFPPDSGYVRVAVETGWLGLLIFCTFMFVILKTGIDNYYKIKDPELKSYCLALVLIIFAFNIGNFPQEALMQYPNSALFYLSAALVNVTLRIDKTQNTPAPENK